VDSSVDELGFHNDRLKPSSLRNMSWESL